jgi:hypothetical protein
MHTIQWHTPLAILALAGALLAACAHAVQPSPERPAWVDAGTGAFALDGRPVLRGVASSGASPADAALRADAALSTLVRVYVGQIMQAYYADAARGNFTEEQAMGLSLALVTSLALEDAHPSGQWIDAGAGEHHALAELDLGAFASRVGAASGEVAPSEGVKRYVAANFLRVHKRLADAFRGEAGQ